MTLVLIALAAAASALCGLNAVLGRSPARSRSPGGRRRGTDAA